MKKAVLLLMAAALVAGAQSALDLTHHWDFMDNGTEGVLADKVGDADMTTVGSGSGIVMDGLGYVSFAGFNGGANATYLAADIDPDIAVGSSHLVSFWMRSSASQLDYAGVVSSHDVKDGSDGVKVWQVDFRDTGVDDNGVIDNLRFASETNVGTQALDTGAQVDILDGDWHNIVVFNRTNAGWSNPAQVFIDGVNAMKDSNWTGHVVQVVLGSNRNADKGFAGDIANVQVWEGDVNFKLVADLYTEGAVVPEPATMLLLGFGALAAAMTRKRS